MDNHILIHADSGICDYYTPANILIAARYVIGGGFDLDPASCAEANKTVNAAAYFTAEDDGLSLNWYGDVFLNHPFSRIGNPLWINKLVAEYESGRVKSAVCICFAAVNAQWFAPLLNYPQFFPAKRINYIRPGGGVARGVTKDSVITYLPRNFVYGESVDRLQTFFNAHGIAGKAK